MAKAIVDAPSEGSVTGFFGLRSVLVGEDPFEVERLWHKMYMGSVYYGRRGAVMQVISGIDIALWDIVGKAVRQPIYKLLGAGYRDKVTAYASTLFRSTPEGMVDASRWYLEHGFKAVKFGWGVFGEDRERDVELVAAARNALGDGTELLIDTGWYVHRTAKEAIQMVKSLEPFRPFLIEEPLSPEDYDGYAQLTCCRHADRLRRAGGDGVGLQVADRAGRRMWCSQTFRDAEDSRRDAKSCTWPSLHNPSRIPRFMDFGPADRGIAASERVHAQGGVPRVQCDQRAAEPGALPESAAAGRGHATRSARTWPGRGNQRSDDCEVQGGISHGSAKG